MVGGVSVARRTARPQAFGTSTEATPAQQAQTLRQCFKLSTDLISSRDLPRILIDFRSFPDDPPCLVLSS